MSEHGCAWGLAKAECYACQTEKETKMTDIVDITKEDVVDSLESLLRVGANLTKLQRFPIEKAIAVIEDNRREISLLESEIERLRAEVEDLKGQVSALDGAYWDLKAGVDPTF